MPTPRPGASSSRSTRSPGAGGWAALDDDPGHRPRGVGARAAAGIRAVWVPLLAGLAVHEAVGQVSTVGTALKWPNDVLVPADGDRKLAGPLCEWTGEGVVVGLGLNVDTAREDLPLDTATSLRAAGHPGVGRAALLSAYLVHLARLLHDDTGPGGPVQAAYRAACTTIGRAVDVHEPAGVVRTGVRQGWTGRAD